MGKNEALKSQDLTERDSSCVVDILSSSMSNLAEQNRLAYTLLVSKAKDGFFEQHQTVGALNTLADRLLAILGERGDGNAD